VIVVRPLGLFACTSSSVEWAAGRVVRWCIASGVVVGCGDRSPPALWPDPPPPTLAAPIGVDDDPSDDALELPRSPAAVPSPGVTTAPDPAAPRSAADAEREPSPDAERSDVGGEPTPRAKPSPRAP
jgi:hypothetical protein